MIGSGVNSNKVPEVQLCFQILSWGLKASTVVQMTDQCIKQPV